MPIDTTIETVRSAAMLALLISAPILLVGVAVGLLIGILQSVTQIQDSVISLVPRMLAMVAVAVVLLPWSITRLVDFSTELIRGIPGGL